MGASCSSCEFLWKRRDAVDRMSLHLAMIMLGAWVSLPFASLVRLGGAQWLNKNFRTRDINQGKSTRGWATSRSWSHFILVSWSRTMEKNHKMDQHGITKPYKTWVPCFSREDIACGIDRNGKDVKIVNLQQTLLKCAAHGISNAALSCLDRILYFEVWYHQSSIFQQI